MLRLALATFGAAAVFAATPDGARAVTGPATTSGPVARSATGSGHFEFTADDGLTALRSFAFDATAARDGTVTGQAQVNNRATGAKLHIRIDCLNVIGNVAVASGIATSATGPENAAGDTEIFGVEDNGQGADAAPDRITRVFGKSGLVCSDITADALPGLAGLFNEIVGGNVQIH
jgi:hypothetical protein